MHKTRSARLLIILAWALAVATAPMAGAETLRFGFAGVVARSDVTTIEKYLRYLHKATGYTFEPVFARTYADMSGLITAGRVDIAYICGGAYVSLSEDMLPVRLLVAPVLNGKPEYYSNVIVRKDSAYQRLEDLLHQPYAFSDPQSLSGAMAPTHALLQRDFAPKQFFRPLIFVYNHADAVQAVHEGLVEGTSVGSLPYAHLIKAAPELAAGLKILERIGPYPATPIVAGGHLPITTAERVARALLDMAADPEGAEVIERLGIEGYQRVVDTDYSVIRDILDAISGHMPPTPDDRWRTAGAHRLP